MKTNTFKIFLGMFFSFWIVGTGCILAPKLIEYPFLSLIYSLSIIASAVWVLLTSLNWWDKTSS